MGIGLIVAIASAVAVIVAAAGYRTQILPLLPAFLLLGIGLLGSLVAVVMSVTRLVLMTVRHQPMRAGVILGLLVALVILAIPASVIISAQRSSNGVPPIHDISTDTNDPPVFVDVLPLRAHALNKAEYGGPQVAAQQHTAFPDIVPLTLPVPPDDAFDRALAAVRGLKWEIAGSNRSQGRIEATDTTFWFGFKDDIVVRLRPAEGGTRVDVRSVSRVGGGDVGTNAKRVRAYIARLKGK